MQQIYLIEYIDAQYQYDFSNHLDSGLARHEAFGYVTEGVDEIIISFTQSQDRTIYMGLIVPKGALATRAAILKPEIIDQIKIGELLTITWLDVVFFTKNTPRTKSTVLETRGHIEAMHADHLVISKPETQIIEPGPLRDHPPKKPVLYRIPLGMIRGVRN